MGTFALLFEWPVVIVRNLSIYLRLLDIQLLNLEHCSGWQQVDFDPSNVSNNAFFVKTIFIKICVPDFENQDPN